MIAAAAVAATVFCIADPEELAADPGELVAFGDLVAFGAFEDGVEGDLVAFGALEEGTLLLLGILEEGDLLDFGAFEDEVAGHVANPL